MRALADRIDLASMRPMGVLASTGYCLAAPGREYLVYLPAHDGRVRRLIDSILQGLVSARAEVDLSATPGAFDVEWVDGGRGVILPGDPVTGGQRLTFHAPFTGDIVLHVKVHAESTGNK